LPWAVWLLAVLLWLLAVLLLMLTIQQPQSLLHASATFQMKKRKKKRASALRSSALERWWRFVLLLH
jgi:hypothetical protein